MKTHDLLLGVGVEEIPDWMIAGALEDFRRRLLEALEKLQLQQGVEVEAHATPRRLVLFARNIPVKQADTKEAVTGPPVAAGPGATQGFARKMGVEPEQLKKVQTPKGEYYSYIRKVKGRLTRELLRETLPAVVLGITWPKTMTWTGKSGPRFIRPIRRLVAVYGGRVVPFEIAGLKSGNLATGHRRLGSDRIRVSDLESLREGLRQNFVLLDAAERRQRIEQGIEQLLSGTSLHWRRNDALLEKLVNMTEWPTPILGGFDREFLSLPEEVLVTVMQHHQKYFSVEDATGKLAPHFIAVMNIDADPDGTVRHGHERVLRARFTDARFFWDTDQKEKLADRTMDLQSVIFHAKLGHYLGKTQRNIELVQKLGGGGSVQRAAELAKCDLTTELVKEFPELQGVIGGLYARAQGEPEEVWRAIYEQYQDAPRTRGGQILAFADRLNTLQAFFIIGLAPTGSKDPFALRRAALGVVRILIEGRHRYTLDQLLDAARPNWAGFVQSRVALREFLLDRARYYFRDIRGYRYDEVNAVLSAGSDDLVDAADRLEALHQVRPTENFEPLATSFKRIKNILRQAAWAGGAEPDLAFVEPGTERVVLVEFMHALPRVESLRQAREYVEALKTIASLRPRVDEYFDKILVMAPDEKIRNNRLAFLAQLLREFSTIADFSEIVISGEKTT